MHLEFFDAQAARVNSPLHRASALSKIAVVAAVVAGMLLVHHPAFYAAAFALVVALAVTGRLPLRELAYLLLYPALFAAAFAVSGLLPAGVPAWLPVARAVVVTASVLLLFATTSYAEVFAFLRLFLPGLLVDALFLTYRAFFILLKELTRTVTAIKMRGGWHPAALRRNLRSAAAALALTALRALEMAERMQSVLALRGYQGRIVPRKSWWRPTPWDTVPLAAAAFLLALGVWL